MSFSLKLLFSLLQLLILMAGAAAASAQPYCYKNVTETSFKTVTKTRIKNVSSRNFFKKIVAKKDTQIEIYEDLEPVYKTKVERICCEGYKMSELDLCEPQCVENGCPDHSKCVEPEVCECFEGYFSMRSEHDGRHHCQPVCKEPCPENSECIRPNQCACRTGYYQLNLKCVPYCLNGCPFGGTCIGPNNCACAEGYKSWKGTCKALCSLGNQCQNGECVEQNVCKCNDGFKWSSEMLKCVLDDEQSSTFSPHFTDTEHLAKVFEENTASDVLATDEYSSTVQPPLATPTHCPDDFVLLEGKCLPRKFASSDMDCWQKPCADENAVCLENGTCACKEGFIPFNVHSNDSITSKEKLKTVCLLPAEYEARMQELISSDEKSENQKATSWTAVILTVLGITILTCALIFLGIKLILRRTGAVDIEGKNLACSYDRRACGEAEKSVI